MEEIFVVYDFPASPYSMLAGLTQTSQMTLTTRNPVTLLASLVWLLGFTTCQYMHNTYQNIKIQKYSPNSGKHFL